MDTNTTRRNLLRLGTAAAAYTAGAALVTGGVALASQAKSAAPAVNPALAKLFAERAGADAELDQWYENVWNPAVERERAAGASSSKDCVETNRLREVENNLWAPIVKRDLAIKAFPVASLVDLSAKLDHLERTGTEPDDLMGTVQADVRRLLAQEGR